MIIFTVIVQNGTQALAHPTSSMLNLEKSFACRCLLGWHNIVIGRRRTKEGKTRIQGRTEFTPVGRKLYLGGGFAKEIFRGRKYSKATKVIFQKVGGGTHASSLPSSHGTTDRYSYLMCPGAVIKITICLVDVVDNCAHALVIALGLDMLRSGNFLNIS